MVFLAVTPKVQVVTQSQLRELFSFISKIALKKPHFFHENCQFCNIVTIPKHKNSIFWLKSKTDYVFYVYLFSRFNTTLVMELFF